MTPLFNTNAFSFSLFAKKSFFLFVTCFTCATGWSQWTLPNGANNINNTNSGGNVGINTTSPWSALDIRTNGSAANGYYGINVQNPSTVAWSTVLINMGTGVSSSAVITAQRNNLGNGSYLFFQTTDASSALQTRMTITDAGGVGIGTSNPGTNALAVEGTIAARKVVVTATNPFPDYVFGPGYPLLPLDSVSRFIQANHHLPGLPSADSVEEKGLDLGNTQTKLLEKIEELTLYTIALQKKVERLEIENKKTESLQRQVDALQKKNGHNR